jgi:ABC-type transport system substrate-binding protein
LYLHDVPLDDDQVAVWPVSKRRHVQPWQEGSIKGRYWMRYAFMPPFLLDEDDNLIASAAIGYDVNQDSTVVTLHLDPNGVFHDGTPLTAAAVKQSFEFGSAPEQQASWGGMINYLRDVQGMDAVGKGDAAEASGLDAIDEHTLLIKLSKPAPAMVLDLARANFGIVNIAALEQDSTWKNHPPGIGQFKVEWNPDTTEATATAVGPGQFWGVPATLAGLSMPVVPDAQTQFIMYENGEADSGPATFVKEDPNHPLYHHLTATRAGGCCFYFGFAFNKPPFEDRDVRAALTHAVDMGSIIPIVAPGSSAAAGMINGDLPCVNPEKSVYAFDPAKAKEHLAMSSYGSAANLPPITVSVRSATFIQIAELMQESWMDNLGVQLNIHIRERGQSIPPDANMYRRSLGAGVPDYASVVWMLGHSASGAIDNLGFETDAQQAEIDALIDAASILPLSHPDRCKQYQEIERRTIERYDRIYLQSVQGNFAQSVVQPWVLGYATQWYGDWYNVPYWKIGKRDLSLYAGHQWPKRAQ